MDCDLELVAKFVTSPEGRALGKKVGVASDLEMAVRIAKGEFRKEFEDWRRSERSAEESEAGGYLAREEEQAYIRQVRENLPVNWTAEETREGIRLSGVIPSETVRRALGAAGVQMEPLGRVAVLPWDGKKIGRFLKYLRSRKR